MDHERLAGMCVRLAGKLEEQWGRLIRDHQRAVAGRGKQRAGAVRELRSRVREAARLELAEFHAHHRGWQRPGPRPGTADIIPINLHRPRGAASRA